MNTFTRLPASWTPHAEPAPSSQFVRVARYAPRPGTGSLPEKALVTWENEGGSLADPLPA